VLIELDQRKVQTAIFPEPRGPRSRIELLHASVTELDIMNFNLLPQEKKIKNKKKLGNRLGSQRTLGNKAKSRIIVVLFPFGYYSIFRNEIASIVEFFLRQHFLGNPTEGL
jgi:hypothetical protein